MKVTVGDKVSVHYVGTLNDGTVFDESRSRGETLDFTLGSGQMIPGFDTAIQGMSVGEKRDFKLTPEEAYGPHIPEAIQKVPKGSFPPDAQLTEGMMVHGTDEKGGSVYGTITEITEDTIVVDHNHPMAGKDLNFSVELVEVIDDPRATRQDEESPSNDADTQNVGEPSLLVDTDGE